METFCLSFCFLRLSRCPAARPLPDHRPCLPASAV